MPARDKSLDFIKFIYILMMITYHCFYNANYNHSLEIDINRYLIYVSGSFPFMAGYLVSAYYFQKIGEQFKPVSGRLLSRGIKLIAIYIALNLIYYLLDKIFNLGITHPTEDAIKSLALGSPSEVIYDILYSIGVVLVYGAALSAIITKVHRNQSMSSLLITSSMLAVIIYIDRSLLIASGLAGIIIGTAEIRCFFDKIYQHKSVIITSYIYGLIVAVSIEHMRTEKLMYITGVITLFSA